MMPIAHSLLVDTSSLKNQLFLESKAMAKHALAAGLKVPETWLDTIELHESASKTKKETTVRGADGVIRMTPPGSASDPGAQPPPSDLARIHARLAELVAPATPRALVLLELEATPKSPWRFLGPVPLVRRLMLTAVASLATFGLVSLSAKIDGNPGNFSVLSNSGWSLLLNEIFLLAAASLGASFSNLFQATRYVKEGTFDPIYESTYWCRYTLGLLEGAILASLLSIEHYVPAAADGTAASGSLQGLGPPILALLGGFSAAAVHRILERLINAVESVVRGDRRDALAAREQQAKARLAEKTVQNRFALVSRLNRLHQQLSSGADSETLRREIEGIQQELMSSEEFSPPAPDTETPPQEEEPGDRTHSNHPISRQLEGESQCNLYA